MQTLETLAFVVLAALLLLVVLLLAAFYCRSKRTQHEAATWGMAGQCLGVECFVGRRKRVQSPGEPQPSQPLLHSDSALSGAALNGMELVKHENEHNGEQKIAEET
ncbi:hypothetical protein AAVH_15729 [Aphelenchoides avenae]|nr:hypothetical protein AAVH_15729 [Aphelenchus avenae]